MPNRQPTESTDNAAPTNAVTAQDGNNSQTNEPFYSDASLWVAFAALVLSYLSYRKSQKRDRSDKFDKRYGDDIRNLGRKLERQLKELNAYIYPSEKTVSEQQAEIVSSRVAIEESLYSITSILREMDQAQDVSPSDWQSAFEAKTTKAMRMFEQLDNLADSERAVFSARVKKAKDQLQIGIDAMRRKLERAKLK